MWATRPKQKQEQRNSIGGIGMQATSPSEINSFFRSL
jgi:hypothetical protein